MVETMTGTKSAFPPHVPEELRWDHDIDRYAAELDDPFLGAARLHQGEPIFFASGATRGRPGWIVTPYALIEEVFTRHDLFSSVGHTDVRGLLGVDWYLNPLEIDPPEHKAYRSVLQPLFQPKKVKELEDDVRQICEELIAPLKARKNCDFIKDFAQLFPSYVFLRLVDLPRDLLPQFLEWEDSFMRAPDIERRIKAARAIKDYLESVISSRRENPGSDLISFIVTTEIQSPDGSGMRRLTPDEVIGMCMTFYLGGLDTVTSSLGWHFRYLASHPDLQQRLRSQPELIPGAVNDLLRAFGVTGTARVVTQDFEFHGVLMKKGEFVVGPPFLASRDPKVYVDPDRIDPERNARHLTFASGVHNCLGIHLAKREIQLVFEIWLKNFDNIHITEGAAVKWHTSGVWGIDQLPLSWD